MSFGQRLEVRQGQGLVMTPQLQQAIKLLAMSNHELAEFVEGELERNPLLEREEGGPETPDAAAAPEPGLSFADTPDAPAARELDAAPEDVNPDAGPADVGGGGTDWSRAGTGSMSDDFDVEATLTREISLHEHLERQLHLAMADPVDRIIGGWLIDHVDDGGYLRCDLDEAAETLGVPVMRIEDVLTRMHRFEPTGVMARSVAECLRLQLQERDRYDPAMAALVDHLDLLARRELGRLLDICGVDAEDLADMIGELRALTPKPGAAFGGGENPCITPDVTVREGPGGIWLVELNADALPRVLMNQRYHAEVSRVAKSDSDRMFVSECAQSANWLVKSLDQRARTILKVAREIVRQQDGFLMHGVAHLRPLNLKTVAAAIEMHESTVSRVTSNKYIATPRGVFELKYFFTASLASADGGDAVSAEAVRHRIKSLIDGEPPQEPLSDDRIVEILRETGVDIARRTVAKYREAMRIPSSVKRRRDIARIA